MDGNDPLRRARRVFWGLLLITTISGRWLWDRALQEGTIVSGRATTVLDALAWLGLVLGALLLTRVIWRLSGRGAKGVGQ